MGIMQLGLILKEGLDYTGKKQDEIERELIISQVLLEECFVSCHSDAFID